MTTGWPILLVLLGLIGQAEPYQVADLLAAARDGGPQTSHAEWLLRYDRGVDAGLVERFTTETVPDAALESNHGDEHGLHELTFDGLPWPVEQMSPEDAMKYARPRETRQGTRRTLARKDEVLIAPAAERPLMGLMGPSGFHDGRPPVDFETVGFAPALWTYAKNPFGIPDSWLEGLESASIAAGTAGSMETLSAVFGGNELRWYFDRRSPQPVRAEFYLQDVLRYASETQFQQADGRWFPKAVKFYRDDFVNPYKVLEVNSASFNKSGHKRSLDEEDLGWRYGTQVHGAPTPGGHGFWDGTEFISSEEFWDLVLLYDVLPDPAVIASMAKLMNETPAQWTERMRGMGKERREAYKREHGEEPWLINVRTEEKDPWDVYVEEFLKKHELKEAGVKRANEQLERAKKVRDAQRRKNHKAMKEAERRKDEDKLKKFKEREERIFKEMLV